jgi:hypothetical protein
MSTQTSAWISMSKSPIVTTSQLFAAATAISAIGFVMVPAPARAGPMLPLVAPACSQWGFDGPMSFRQSNNWGLTFDSRGPRAQGPATARNRAVAQPMHGTISGGIDGYAVNLEVRWDSGSVGKYEGSVDANGFANGVTYDAKHTGSTATWNSNSALRCITPAPS